ncbi:hypothetical protein BAE44_0024394 [Dichanthelium oligosanthes]|uniref:SUI1 domain-containing protein n=1 Tax=Dichanthelium oligosanthes TaxID=888268 RepID=A0A1E5UP09_9POAL|nr:hypothetical protein BAE44_0024394 [Dichanthelium oligosanthes]
MSAATVVDDKALADCLNEISRALPQTDVRFETVGAVQSNIKAVQRAVAGELCRMLDPGKPPLAPAKGKPSVVMFVGLCRAPGRRGERQARGGQEGDGQRRQGRQWLCAVQGQQRNGCKSLTMVQGLSAAYNYTKILRDLKRELCCSGIVVEDEDLGNVQLQGDHRKAVAAFLV